MRITKTIQTKYDKLKVDVLRGLLSLRNLPTKGRKAELTWRLFQDDSTNEEMAALRALEQQPTVMNPSPKPVPKQISDPCFPRQNHTSYYKSLDTAQLVYHLHERALSVHGDQEELVERLREYDWDGSESGYSESYDEEEGDRTASFYDPTIIHQNFYDGKGLHPSIFVGLRIQGWYLDGSDGLRLHFAQASFHITLCGWPWPTSVGLSPIYAAQIKVDKILRNGLRSVQELDEQGLSKKTGMAIEKEPGNLLIVRAVVAERKGPRGNYRVVGLQCEGMSAIGYVYAEARYGVIVQWKMYGDAAVGGSGG